MFHNVPNFNEFLVLVPLPDDVSWGHVARFRTGCPRTTEKPACLQVFAFVCFEGLLPFSTLILIDPK